jgi:aminopeptidase N
MTELAPENADVDRIDVAVEAHRSVQGRGRALIKTTEDILRFYAGVIGDAPYSSTTIALLESELPGGHSPGYFAVLNSPVTSGGGNWRGDPASFDNYPEFFIAHELAHQWWGQAVGWKNYHEQWLSEGFAQYFAALYAQRARGERTFIDMLRQFRRWSIDQSDQGPVHLGYRLGHLKADLRVFRALVYNKGAATLHMLRRLLGDDVFFSGIRRFYADRRYQKAGTDDFERAMEAASGRTLDRFFERWIYGTAIPRVTYSTTRSETEVVVRFEQQGDLVFDIPITVTLTAADGRTTDVIVPVTDKRVEWTIPVTGLVRQVQVNRDFAAVAEISGR